MPSITSIHIGIHFLYRQKFSVFRGKGTKRLLFGNERQCRISSIWVSRTGKQRAAGAPPLSERMEMLVQHRQTLNEQIAQLQEHKIKLDEKIEFNKNEMV